MKKVIVDEKNDGKSLNQFLSFCFPALKQNMFFKALRKKDIRINGQRIRENVTVKAGDEIEVYISDNYLTETTEVQKNDELKVVYEDDNILVIDKPAGISVTEEADRIIYMSCSTC